jgi:hypothetical protein
MIDDARNHEREDNLVYSLITVNPLNAELNPICHLLAFLGAHHILHVSRIRVKLATCFDPVGLLSGLHYEPVNVRKLRTSLGSQHC